MQDILIQRIEDSPVSYGEVVDLLHLAFQDRLKEGLHYTCSDMSVEQYVDRTRNGVVLVAVNPETNALLGTSASHLEEDSRHRKYGEYEYLAIHPQSQSSGIASRLFQEHLRLMQAAGAEYILSDTAVKAGSAVRHHRRCGFKIIGLRSFRSTNYYSYLFRRQLVTDTFRQKLYTSSLYCWLRFIPSCLRTRAFLKPDGTKTKLGKIFS